jgi:hypothetical protein
VIRPAAPLVLLVLLTLLLGGCDDGPRPAAAPAPTTVPWWQGGVLHVDGSTVPTELRQIEYAGGTTIVGATDVDRSVWDIVRDGRLQPLVRARSLVLPVLADDGSRVVWVQETSRRELRPYHAEVAFRAVAYDVASGRPAGTWRTRAKVVCCDASGYLFVDRVEDDGSVLLGRIGFHRLRWRPGSDPVRLPGRETGPPPRAGVAAPGGDPVAFLATADGSRPPKLPRTVPWVRREGDLVRLDAPLGVRIVAWEDAGHVLLATRAPVRFLRCSAATGACEETADRPGRHVRLPSAR